MGIEALEGGKFDAIAEKLSDLYIIYRKRFLKLYNCGDNCGTYKTEIFRKNTDTFHDNSRPLSDYHLKSHLRRVYTVGVFANPKHNITKFICFDVDVPDIELAKEVVTKIIDTLNCLGITNDYIYVSWSGNKGYHVEIFFNKPLENNIVEKFFNIVIYKADLMDIDNGKVEFLPTNSKGVKLPLGINFRGKNALDKLCLYVDYENGFNYIRSKDFVLQIQKIRCSLIQDITDINHRAYESYLFRASFNTDLINHNGANNCASPLTSDNTPTINYMTASLAGLLKLEDEGLIEPGTRNSATVALATLFKCHYGFNREECIERLTNWMSWQDKKYYKTPIDEFLNEINRVVECVYNNNYQLSGGNHKIEISKKEIEEILKVKSKNGKLVLFAILLHSKKYYKNNKFYMSFYQMKHYTGLSKNTCETHLNKLVNNNFIEAVSRNEYFPDGKSKKANSYRVLIGKEKDDPVLCFSFPSIDHKMTRKAFLECLSTIDEKVIRRRFNKKDFSHYKNKKYYVI